METNTASKRDADGIDADFGKEISRAMGTSIFPPRPSDLRKVEVKPPETPLDRAHGVLSQAQGLCTRLDALCAALIGETGASSPGAGDRDSTLGGLMGKLTCHAEETADRIADAYKRMEEIEQTMLGHGGNTSSTH